MTKSEAKDWIRSKMPIMVKIKGSKGVGSPFRSENARQQVTTYLGDQVYELMNSTHTGTLQKKLDIANTALARRRVEVKQLKDNIELFRTRGLPCAFCNATGNNQNDGKQCGHCSGTGIV